MSSNITPLYFLSWNIIYFGQKQPIKVKIFEIFECSGQNLLNYSFQFCTDKSSSSLFASLFIVNRHNSLVNLKLIHNLLLTKRCYQSHNFETFKCSGESFPNFSCHFWKHKSVFPQTLNQSWELLCTFLAQTLYTLDKSSPSKCKVLRLSSALVKTRQIPYVNFETTSWFLFRFFIFLQCNYRNNSSINF